MTEAENGDEWRRRAGELADELRGIMEALAFREVSAEALARATERTREIRRDLDGPARPRWYQGDANDIDEAARRAYLDQSPIRGRLNPIAPPLVSEVVERADGTRVMEGHARLGSAYEGPPHGVHGGWVAALFDDLLGAAQILAEARGVTAKLEIHYRHVTPIDEDLRLTAWIEETRERRMVARATCHAGDLLTADAEGTFVIVDWNEIQARMSSRRS